jgi:hypothetical protein
MNVKVFKRAALFGALVLILVAAWITIVGGAMWQQESDSYSMGDRTQTRGEQPDYADVPYGPLSH